MMKSITFAVVSLIWISVARADCPSKITTAIETAFEKAKISTCKLEHEHGHDQYEVKLARPNGSLVEVDVSSDGKILQTEEVIAVSDVPAAVMKAFFARYPKAKVDRVEKQTPSEGQLTFELAFTTDKGRKEATFGHDGAFVGEE